MINKSILTTSLVNKFNLLTLHSIVNECFINGLPIPQNSIEDSEKKALTKYSYKVLSQLGGFSALENAILNESLSKQRRLYLGDIYEVCTEASKTAAKRIANETDCKDPSVTLNDVVDKASFTDKEYKTFVSKVEKLDLDSVSNIIKDKTLAVIKDEQEQYEKEETLDSELKDALAESKNFSDTTTEAYMDLVLEKMDPRHHVTVFSKLQDAAMEMMTTIKVGDHGTDAMPIVDKVTFEAFLSELTIQTADIDKCYEAYSQICNEEICEVDTNDRPKLAMLVSVIVYTIMETLKTMNIYCPSQDSIKKFVSSTSDINKVDTMTVNNVLAKAQEMLQESNKKDLATLDSSQLTNILVELKKISEILDISVNNGYKNDMMVARVNIINELNNVINEIKTILNNRNDMMKNASESSTNYYKSLDVKHDIAQFNKINNLFSKNPNVSEIRLNIASPDNITSIIDVVCVNESGVTVKSSFMDMRAAVESSQYINYLKDSFNNSNLASTTKKVSIKINDGRGQKIMLN